MQNFAYHQKSINSSSISGAAGNKSPKSGRSRSARENSTLPPKPRAEGSSPSAPAIVTGACKRLRFGVCGLFPCQNRPMGHALKIPDFRGKILQTPPIFVNNPTAAVWYIIKKASANFGKRTVLYRVPRMGIRREYFYVPEVPSRQISITSNFELLLNITSG